MAAYLAAVLLTLAQYPRLQLRLQLDDQPPFDQPSTMTAITNGRCFGNGFWVCPAARPDDGLFDLMVARQVSRLTILRLVPKFLRGSHVGEAVLQMHQARRVRLESASPLVVEADGEFPFRAARALEISILPQKVQMIV
jgi:diacylglycerol kinase (ATP)